MELKDPSVFYGIAILLLFIDVDSSYFKCPVGIKRLVCLIELTGN